MSGVKSKPYLTSSRGSGKSVLGDWGAFWMAIRGEHSIYESVTFYSNTAVTELKRGMSCMRIYRNTDGTWSLMPNWFNNAEQNHKRALATNYETFSDMPVAIQEKLGVLMMKDAGSEWLAGVGKRVDDGVFWLEDG